jgi:hypothetical protein
MKKTTFQTKFISGAPLVSGSLVKTCLDAVAAYHSPVLGGTGRGVGPG